MTIVVRRHVHDVWVSRLPKHHRAGDELARTIESPCTGATQHAGDKRDDREKRPASPGLRQGPARCLDYRQWLNIDARRYGVRFSVSVTDRRRTGR